MTLLRSLLVFAAIAAGCAAPPAEEAAPTAVETAVQAPRLLETPAPEGSFAPRLAAAGDDVAISWIEPGVAAETHRVRFARLSGQRWSPPSTIVEGGDLFANWADFPGVVAAADGTLYAHWLAKTAEATYAYSIFLARSADGGATWEQLGRLNDDATDTEHGFVSWVPEGPGVRAVWLDGREMAAGGPMTLRTAVVGGAGAEPSELLDERVCECCNTAAAQAGEGRVVVAYRDRGPDELRDVWLVRGGAGGWSSPAPAPPDGWRIAGCPVNGPAVAAAGPRVALAWFTAADNRPTVRAALSADGGETFGPPVTVDADAPLGRVDAALAAGSAWVTWMAPDGDEAEIRLLEIDDAGEAEPLVVARTSAARASGFPRLLAAGGRLLVAWTEIAEGRPPRVRLAEVPIEAGAIRVASRTRAAAKGG